MPGGPRCVSLSVIVGCTLALAVSVGCHRTPKEAAPPDASAWPDDEGFDPGPQVQTASSPSSSEVMAEPASPPPKPRPRHTIFRDELLRAVGPGPAYLLRQLAPEPFRHQGHFVGWTITQIFPDDPSLCADPCDLSEGDVILGVNGHRLHTPQELSDALSELPQWTHLQVVSLRDGQRRKVTYTIADR